MKRSVPPSRLLVYDVREGWGPLCDYLSVDEPEEPFPRLNDTAQMRRGMLTIRALSIALPAALALSVAAALVLLRRRAGKP